MKQIILTFILTATAAVSAWAQGYDEDRIVLAHFIERMYKAAPFEGCRIIDDYTDSWFLTVVTLDAKKYPNASTTSRVAEVKSQRAAGEFFNGTSTYTEFTVKTPRSEENGSDDMPLVYDVIRSNSSGFVKQLQLFTTFLGEGGETVYIYAKIVDKPKGKNKKKSKK